jgi:hypothetical protein
MESKYRFVWRHKSKSSLMQLWDLLTGEVVDDRPRMHGE